MSKTDIDRIESLMLACTFLIITWLSDSRSEMLLAFGASLFWVIAYTMQKKKKKND